MFVAYGVLHLAGRIRGSIPRWFGAVFVVLGISYAVLGLAPAWFVDFLWVFASLGFGALFLDQGIRVFRHLRELRVHRRTEEERFSSAFEDQHQP
jgi:putative exporter of polyketide antibiotics